MKKMLYILVFLTLCIGIERINAYTEYKIGDVVSYNGIDFYIIKNSDSNDNSVTMLKAEPLTIAEVNQYGGVGTTNNHVNKNACQSSNTSCYQTASNVYGNSGYGGMAYYSSEECGYNSSGNYVTTGCKLNYAESDIKYVVDAWATDKVGSKLQEARLLTLDDMMDDLGIEMNRTNPTSYQIVQTEDTPQWVFGENYYYWTMTPNTDKDIDVWNVNNRSSGYVRSNYVHNYYDRAVRPVITVKKTALGDEEENIVDGNIEKEEDKSSIIDTKDNIDDTKTNESKATVKVANTYMSSSIIIIILGFITASVSVLIIYKFSNKKR